MSDDRTDYGKNISSSDKNIPIVQSRRHKFQFGKRWFRARNQSTWSTYILGEKFNNDKPANMLQIGVWEGMDLVWCLQNILGHPKSRAIAVDPWAAMPPKHDQAEMNLVAKRAASNLEPWKAKLQIIRDTSQNSLKTLPGNSFDLIVVDGWHQRNEVARDGLQAVLLSKQGGWIVFDDVRNKRYRKGDVYDGVQEFLKVRGGQVKVAWQHRHCDCYEVV